MLTRKCICCKKFYGKVKVLNSGITGGCCFKCGLLLGLRRVFKRLYRLESSDYLPCIEDIETLINQRFIKSSLLEIKVCLT